MGLGELIFCLQVESQWLCSMLSMEMTGSKTLVITRGDEMGYFNNRRRTLTMTTNLPGDSCRSYLHGTLYFFAFAQSEVSVGFFGGAGSLRSLLCSVSAKKLRKRVAGCPFWDGNPGLSKNTRVEILASKMAWKECER
jgi:hypothetical protein